MLDSMKKLFALILLALASSPGAQTTPPLGIRTKTPQLHAYTNADIIVSPDKRVSKGTLVVKDGRILDVGTAVTIPRGAVVTDLTGKLIYPGFIDPFTEYGLKALDKPRPARDPRPRYEGTRIGANAWNDAIHAERNSVTSFQPDAKQAEPLMKQGITVVQSAKLDGVFRGRSFVTLLGGSLANDQLLVPRSIHFAAFNKGTSEQNYPSSLMGSIALVRQSLLDAAWYSKAQAAIKANPRQKAPETNLAISALASAAYEKFVFDSDDELSLLRASRIAAEFGITFVHVGSGHEYERIKEIAATGQPVILPVNFPKPPEIKSADDDLDVSLADLRHWERAPYNPQVLEANRVPFAFTAHHLKDTSQFLKNIRRAVKLGLTEKAALAALTTIPASFCSLTDDIGTLEKGKLADFVICDGELFHEKTRILATVVRGEPKEFIPLDQVDFRGEWTLSHSGLDMTLSLKGEIDKIKGELRYKERTVKLSEVTAQRDRLLFSAKTDTLGFPGIQRFTARRDQDRLSGARVSPDLTSTAWMASFKSAFQPEKDSSDNGKPLRDSLVSKMTSPNMAYGFATPPQTENVLIKNATVWTSEPDGILTNADILIMNGKFTRVGANLTAPAGVRVIDAKGKHVTAGIVDTHSHVAISGDVNEGAASVTSEVRIGDVVDPDDINVYRALAGGVTTIHLLHGSANSIGGQLQVIKCRWGASSEEMKFAAAPPTIKFALGENVKQSNWGDQFTIRYPQTRMGVETIMKDAFQAARENETEWTSYNALNQTERTRTVPPRRDLTLEALSNVLKGTLLIHCHSYVASEMLMLMRLAEQYGFTVQNFTHVLEGYKVADEMAAHGASAGSFSDWWAYKFEVYDAIPQNPCLLHDRGVVTCINSDSPESGRRLNQEAAKSVMYCGMSQEEAIKLVTLYPAVQLRVQDRVGSIKEGKDADFVIWSDNPLSIYARALQTWVDGKNYFDLETDRAMALEIRREKSALIQKVLAQGKEDSGPHSRDGYKMPGRVSHCEDVMDYWKEVNAYEAQK